MTLVAYSPHILVVNPAVPVSTAQELVALAKAKPGKLNFAISGLGGAPHLAGVDFALRTGIRWEYIPYKGGSQAIADVAGGQADVTLNGMLATYPLVKGGKLKILAVSSAQRMSAIPDVPTIAESGAAGLRDRLVAGRGGARGNATRRRRAPQRRDRAHRRHRPRCARASVVRAPRCAPIHPRRSAHVHRDREGASGRRW